MSRKKVTTTVYFTPAQVAGLKALSDRTKVPFAEYVRQGVDHVLKIHASQLSIEPPHVDCDCMSCRPWTT